MANEVIYSSLGDARVAAILHSTFLELYQGPAALGQHPALQNIGRLNGRGSDVIKVPAFQLKGYNPMTALGSETGATANTALTDTSYSVTVAPYTLARTVGDMARVTAPAGWDEYQLLALDMYYSWQAALLSAVAGVVDGFTAVKGTSGAVMTYETWLDAHAALDAVEAPSERIALLRPIQWAQLQKDIALNTGGAVQVSQQAQEIIQRKGPGYKGNIDGTDVYTSNLVTDNATDFLGGLWAQNGVLWGDAVPPVDSELGDVLIGGVVKVRKQGVADTITTKMIGSAYFGVSMGTDGRGVVIRSRNS